MGKSTGFLEFNRKVVPYRDSKKRINDFEEIFSEPPIDHLKEQSARCMDCGVPFCQSNSGCPIDNLIPEWNDLVYQGRWKGACDIRQDLCRCDDDGWYAPINNEFKWKFGYNSIKYNKSSKCNKKWGQGRRRAGCSPKIDYKKMKV